MKVIYDENEKELLNESRSDLIKDGHASLFDDKDPKREYSISFTVTDYGVAEYVLLGLLYDRLNDFDLGIDVRSINFGDIQNVYDVKRKLHEAIDEIIK